MARKQMGLYAGSVLLAFALLLIGRDRITAFIAGDVSKKIPAATLMQELNSIHIPKGDIIVQKPRAVDRVIATEAAVNLRSRRWVVDVFGYYRTQLVASGWKFESSDRHNREDIIKFCKSGASLTIDARQGDAGLDYYLAIVWTKFKADPAYCPPVPDAGRTIADVRTR